MADKKNHNYLWVAIICLSVAVILLNVRLIASEQQGTQPAPTLSPEQQDTLNSVKGNLEAVAPLGIVAVIIFGLAIVGGVISYCWRSLD